MTGKKRGRPPKKKVVVIEEEEPEVQVEPQVEQPKIEKPKLTTEQAAMEDALFNTLVSDVGIDEVVAIELAEKYKTLSNFAKVVRAGEDLHIEDEKEKARLRLIALSH